MPALIFVSHDSEDRERARQLVEHLERSGYQVWWDAHVVAGQRFGQRISEALARADCVVSLWSVASVASDWVKDEAAEGLRRGCLVPVLMDPVEIPLGFRQIHAARVPGWTDASVPAPDFSEVLRAVSTQVGRSTDSLRLPLSHPPAGQPERHSALPAPRGGESPTRWPLLVRVALVAAVLSALAGVYQLLRKPAPPSSGPVAVSTSAVGAGAAITHAAISAPGIDVAADQGIVDFRWPGADCWLVVQGERSIASGCGAGKHALAAGPYTLKGQFGAPFAPVLFTISAGIATSIAAGGIFDFRWPGGECWQVFRGEQLAAGNCGAARQALQGGSYTLKGQFAAPFAPQTVVIRDGVDTVLSIGGVLDFRTTGSDCWQVLRGDERAASGCGAGVATLQAGRYTLTPQFGTPFPPIAVEIKDGETSIVP